MDPYQVRARADKATLTEAEEALLPELRYAIENALRELGRSTYVSLEPNNYNEPTAWNARGAEGMLVSSARPFDAAKLLGEHVRNDLVRKYSALRTALARLDAILGPPPFDTFVKALEAEGLQIVPQVVAFGNPGDGGTR